MKAKSDIAADKFSEGYNCAQAVLFSFCEDLGLDQNTALKFACGLGAGMARKQEVCGAVTGGILALGFKHGRGDGQGKAQTEATYGKVREFMARFESKQGSCLCRTLLEGCDLNTPAGQQYFKEHNLLKQTCTKCVKTAVEAVEAVI